MSRVTRGKAHPQPAFKVAHLAAGGLFSEKRIKKVVVEVFILRGMDQILEIWRGWLFDNVDFCDEQLALSALIQSQIPY